MTETSTNLIYLSLTALSILFAATMIGEVLRAKFADSRPHPTIETYLTRVRSWWMMTILTALALLSGPGGVVLLFAFCSFAALREFLTLTTKTRADHWSMVASFYLILPAQYILIWLGQTGLTTVLIPVYAFLLLPILSALRGTQTKFLARISETQWALMTCVYCTSHVPALVTLEIKNFDTSPVLLIAFLVVVVQLADLVDYFAGRRIGKTKIAEAISPKTWEGFGAAVTSAAVMGAALSWITPFGPFMAAAMAVIAYSVGAGGSLVLRAIKRDLGVKDWGHLIPGQGGLIDQLDSVIFAAPIFYHL